jgi:hypothetical protein
VEQLHDELCAENGVQSFLKRLLLFLHGDLETLLALQHSHHCDWRRTLYCIFKYGKQNGLERILVETIQEEVRK